MDELVQPLFRNHQRAIHVACNIAQTNLAMTVTGKHPFDCQTPAERLRILRTK
jgi:hypothetical protein